MATGFSTSGLSDALVILGAAGICWPSTPTSSLILSPSQAERTCAPAGRWLVRLPILAPMRRFASAAPSWWGTSTLIGALIVFI